ncbi:hypothetical protein GCK32_011984 [Trichostrongylus colubriformis]|uniref:Fucosyltransferase N-terminal domain-containing protein n=1 Tax=Trichostrongylus colubriformis TaxID=6319 RepID=A0AAN8FL09_TRICO
MRKDRFTWLMIVCFCAYFFMILYLILQRQDVYVVYGNYFHLKKSGKMGEMVDETTSFPDDTEEPLSSVESMVTETEDKYELLFEVESKFENVTFYGEEILTFGNISLKERMTCNFNRSERPRLILAPIDSGTLDGCPEWNCKIEHNFEKLDVFDAIVTISSSVRQRYDQYIVFFSQESPYHIWLYDKQQDYNMSLGYRRDSPVASPYGYTVKLAKRSRLTYSVCNFCFIKKNVNKCVRTRM